MVPDLEITAVEELFDHDEVIVLSALVHPSAVHSLSDEEARLVARAVEKRQREFATARVVARAGLTRLGRDVQQILNAPDRSPIWPEGVSGSISHSDNRVVVAMGLSERVGGLGVDVEHRHELKRELWKSVFLDAEVEYLDRVVPVARRGVVALTLFSAKEALYKAQHPRSKRFMGFHELRVDLAGDPMSDRGELICVFQNDVPPFASGTIVRGRYRLDAFAPAEVVTAVRIAPDCSRRL